MLSLAVAADSRSSRGSVREALTKERRIGTSLSGRKNAAVPLNLDRTLEEINQDAALLVREGTGGKYSGGQFVWGLATPLSGSC